MADEPFTPPLRNVPIQARSRERLRRVIDAADELLVTEGADAFTTNRIAQHAGPVQVAGRAAG